MIPADARLICDYYKPELFQVYKQQRAQDADDSLQDDDNDSDSEDIKHDHQNSFVAADQSAITGESLAVCG